MTNKTITEVEKIIKQPLKQRAVIFTFPGIGIGNTHPQLTGCTLQNAEMENTAYHYSGHDIDFVGLSTCEIPLKSQYIQYYQIGTDCDIFEYVQAGGASFLQRSLLLISGENIEKIVHLDAKDYGDAVQDWIDREI